MSGIIVSGNYGKDLLPGVVKFFGLGYKDWDSKFDKIFDVSNTKERYTEDMIVSGLGLAKIKPEGQAADYDSSSQGWLKRYEQSVYSIAFKISREAMDDGHALNLSKDLSQAAKKSMLETREVVCANILNRAFNSSYTGGDGIVLCSVSHPTKAAGNQQNKPTVDAALGEAILEQSDIDLMGLLDERGLKMFVQGRKLIIPPALKFSAKRVLGGLERPATADRDVNAMHALDYLQDAPVINPYLTSSTVFFIKTDCEKGLRYIERDGMEITDENDWDTESAKFKARMRFVAGWSDWRGVYGVNAS